jgi:hypothetical protein
VGQAIEHGFAVEHMMRLKGRARNYRPDRDELRTKSRPLRDHRRTVSRSLKARIRKPSCAPAVRMRYQERFVHDCERVPPSSSTPPRPTFDNATVTAEINQGH